METPSVGEIMQEWYIVKESSDKPCVVLKAQEMEASGVTPEEKWGPFETKNQAIAKRVGLIRAGKCKPS